MIQYLSEINMKVLTCCSCGIAGDGAVRWIKERENDHKSFYCPNGHKQYFPHESDEECLRRQLKQQILCCNEAKEEAALNKRRFWGLKGHVAKLKKKG
jgi:hypothetical protein